MRFAVLIAGLCLAACGKPAAMGGGGTAQFRFAVGDMAKSGATSPLKGTFYGDIFLQEDVAITGPRDDAMAFQSIDTGDIDLTMKGVGEPAEATFTTMKLPPGKYTVLGFFDIDGNGATARRPDSGDPVTLALTNKFEIFEGMETKRLVLFEILYN